MSDNSLTDSLAKIQCSDEREMDIDEYCEQLPDFHLVNKQLRVLNHCRNHPLQWSIWDFLRKHVPFINWKAPL